MVEGRGSTLVHILVVILCLVAFGFAIAAERRSSVVKSSSFTEETCYWKDSITPWLEERAT